MEGEKGDDDHITIMMMIIMLMLMMMLMITLLSAPQLLIRSFSSSNQMSLTESGQDRIICSFITIP